MRSRVLSEIVALLAPPGCLACRAPPADPRAVLCPACLRTLPWLVEPRCRRCALPAPCDPCPGRGSLLAAAWAPLAHAGPARQLVAAVKFRGALVALELMAAQMTATAPPGLLAGATLVPVPAHAGRRRTRGHDHVRRLAAGIAARAGLPVLPCLRRTGPATRQVGAGRRDRRAPGRVGVEATGPVPPVALLIDDVHTTGATLAACARALRAAGAQEVRALTYVRALRGGR